MYGSRTSTGRPSQKAPRRTLSINGPKSVKRGVSNKLKFAQIKNNQMQSDAAIAPPDDYEYLSEANLERMSSIKSTALRS